MERPDFFTLKNGTKAKLPFSNKEYNNRVSSLRVVMDKKNLSTLTPILSNVFARRPISVLDRHFTCQCFEKTERAATFYKKKISSHKIYIID